MELSKLNQELESLLRTYEEVSSQDLEEDKTQNLFSRVSSPLQSSTNPRQIVEFTHFLKSIEKDLDPKSECQAVFFKTLQTAQGKLALVGGNLSIRCLESNLPVFHRMSLGMYHTNLSILTSVKYSTLRLTLGLDPAQIDVLANALSEIDTLND